MIWTDSGYLLTKIPFQENSIIVNFYTKNHGKYSGIIYGATSKKIKNYLQKGNELYLEYHSKSDNALGYFKVEIIKPHTSEFFSDKTKLNCIVSTLELIKILTVDGQKNSQIYDLIDNFYLLLNNKNWKTDYIYWEFKLLKYVGFDLNISEFCKYEVFKNDKRYYIETSSKKLTVPNFLMDDVIEDISDKDIFDSLTLLSEYMKKNIFIPNNINFPSTRQNFINYFK
ncbi:MAG: DNA repair protein RecO [Candidatus Pelagibacter sp.]